MSEISRKGYVTERFAQKILEHEGFEVIFAVENEKTKLRSVGILLDDVEDRMDKLQYSGRITQQISEEEYRIIHIPRKMTEDEKNELNDLEKKRKKIEKEYDLASNRYRGQKKKVEKIIGKNILTLYLDYFCKRKGKYYVIDIKRKEYKPNKNLNNFYFTHNELERYDKIESGQKAQVEIMIILAKEKQIFYRRYGWKRFSIPKKRDPKKEYSQSLTLKNGFDVSKLKKFSTNEDIITNPEYSSNWKWKKKKSYEKNS